MFSISKIKNYFDALALKHRRAANSIKLNEADRFLVDKRIVFNVKASTTEEGYLINGTLVRSEGFIDKAAIFAVNFFDAEKKRLEIDRDFSGLSLSSKFGNYRYLTAAPGGVPFQMLILPPPGAESFKLEIVAKGGVSPILKAGATVERISIKKNRGFTEVIGAVDRYARECQAAKIVPDVDALQSQVGVTSADKERALAVTKAFKYYLASKSEMAPFVGWLAYRSLPDNHTANIVRKFLTEQGHLYKLKDFIDEVNQNPPAGWKHSTVRLADDIARLESGFPMPAKKESSAYQPSRRTLYLLHNSLPYNSGGYATRSHGLLTGVHGIGQFKPHGVSRPGYPTDHQKYISFTLPKDIPAIDTIDNIDYIRCNQTTRRSHLTLTEYIEVYARELEAISQERQIGIIHAASNYPNGLAASLAARRLGISSVYEVRGLWEVTRMSRQNGWSETDQFRYMAKMEAEACNHADRVIAITSALKDLMIERGVDRDKISVVPNCVHTDLFLPSVERDAELADKLGISPKDVVIGYIGSVVNYEGLKDLIRAVKVLTDQGVKNFRLLVVGDGAVLAELKELASTLSLGQSVIFTGRVPHSVVQRYYSLVDITPFPREPFLVCELVSPLKPFEALASGKAVLVSSCAALIEIIQDGITGLVFNKGDHGDLAAKLRILIEDPALRQHLGRKGREWVVANRDWKNAASTVTSIYESLAA